MKLYDPIRFDVYLLGDIEKDKVKKRRTVDPSYLHTIFIRRFEEEEINEIIRKLKCYNKQIFLRLIGKENLRFYFYKPMYVKIQDYVYEFYELFIDREDKHIKFGGSRGSLFFDYFFHSELVKLQNIEFDVI